MDKKLVIFDSTKNEITKNLINNILPCLKNHVIYDGSQQPNVDYYIKNKDNRMFEGVLNYCEELKIGKLFITLLTNPEYLLAELNSRKKFKTKIVFGTDLRLPALSKARANVYADLIINKNIERIIVQSNGGKDALLDQNCHPLLSEFGINKSLKLKPFYDPIYHKIFREEYSKKELLKKANKIVPRNLGLKETDTILLFFGSMNYGKGFLDLITAAENLSHMKNVKILVCSYIGYANFNVDLKRIQKLKNVVIIDKYFTNDEMFDLFDLTDYVILPYTDTYKYGSSANFVTACQFCKPMIVPDFYPFSEIIREHKFGIRFNREKKDSLTNAIISILNIGKNIDKNSFKNYTKKIQSWPEFTRAIIGENE